mgnify:CR=1 FL=1
MTLNAIIANFQTFKLVDLLDIIIISFLIYQLLALSTAPAPASCSRVRCW